MRFTDRTDAGEQLAIPLQKFATEKPIIYALPRGGVVLGAVIAKALNAPLDLIITRKIGHPSNEEYAICAIGESGAMVCNEAERAAADPAWFARAVVKEKAEARRRHKTYLGGRPSQKITGLTVIIVDDGIATGLTMRAAIKEVRQHKPGKVIVAIPVAPREAAELLRQEADQVVVLDEAEFFLGAVGAYYEDFSQISDEEVARLLRPNSKRIDGEK